MTERLVVWHRWLPPRAEQPEDQGAIVSWQRSVSARLQAAGGEILGAIGGSLAATFDPGDVVDVIDMALDLATEAEASGIGIALGVALGEVESSEDAFFGAAIARAEALCGRARAGEVVLDMPARAITADELLFARKVGAGAGGPRGITIDRRHPKRSECAAAIARLGPPSLPPNVDQLRDELAELVGTKAVRNIVMRGPVGAGAAELVAALEGELAPSRVLHIGAAPGGVVPLASLRLALLRSFGDTDSVAAGIGALATEASEPLARVAAGELVIYDELANALQALLTTYGTRGRPWVVMNPLSLVDGATLAVLLGAREQGGDFVLFGRFPIDEPLPRPLARLSEPVHEFVLPALRTADARVVAQSVLGLDTGAEVTRRVAVLGGDTVLGVVEAARTLIADGELVMENNAFVWRTKPRAGSRSVGIDQLFAQRLGLLDPPSRRVLETLCVVPDGSPQALIAQVTELDGIGENGLGLSCARLEREALILGGERPRPSSSLLRWRVMSMTPPARSMELHRFAAEVLARTPSEAPTLRSELGYYLCEGGKEIEGRAILETVLSDLVKAGYERAARHIAAVIARFGGAAVSEATPVPAPEFDAEPPSVELPLSEEWREQIAKATSSLPPPRSAPPPPRSPPPPAPSSPPARQSSLPPPTGYVGDIVRALRERDFERLERAIQRAIAEGSDMGAVDRVRAVAELARGDLDAARAHLHRARRGGRDDVAAHGRYLLAEALLEVQAGEPVAAVRAGLGALACSRQLGDVRGETAALRTLARCYRTLGRAEQAAAIEAVATA